MQQRFYGLHFMALTPKIDSKRLIQSDLRIIGKAIPAFDLIFWFDSRKTNATTSYDIGYYRIQSTNIDAANSIYGQFHIVLQKLNGTWKITQDWDTSTIKGETITAVDFEKQKPLTF